MTNTKFGDIDTHLRKWGLTVVEVAGWQTRSSNWTKIFSPRAVYLHHTAGSATGNAPSLSIVKNGRPGIPGPLAQFVLGRDGTVYLVCADRANHAGVGGPHQGIPKDSGNAYAWGIEAENTGRGEKWSAKQLNAYYRLCAALMDYSDIKDVSKVFGHKEWTTRKIDPSGLNMDQFRNNVKAALKAGPLTSQPPTTQTILPTFGRLKYKNTHSHVGLLQKELARRGFYKGEINNFYDWNTRLAVQAFQQQKLGLKGKDADGLIGPYTYQKLFGKKP